jgi:mannose-1-phosphate guanylyltransferase
MTKHAIILAGGKGERLRPYTNDRPKPMLELGGKPILFYQLEQLKRAGIRSVVFAVSYQRDFLMNSIGTGEDWGIKAFYSVEDAALGRGGAIKKAMSLIAHDWENVVVTNGDNLWKIDVGDLISQHVVKASIATVVVAPLRSPYGIVEFDRIGRVESFREKPILPHWVNAGAYIMNKKIAPFLPEVGDHEVWTFPKLSKDKFHVYKSNDYWRGIDTVKDLLEANQEIEHVFPAVKECH